VRIERSTYRLPLYLALLALLSAPVFFLRLGGESMGGDESLYALCVDHMRASGDWIYISPRPPAPYFQKPPLQMWLSALTAGLFDDGDYARYRLWSAIFATGAVLLTATLGARLVSAELGLLAGLVLLTNRKFLVDHGARSGAFDAGIAFFCIACALLAWSIYARQRNRTDWLRWLVMGVCAGAAGLLKPFIGLLFLALVAVFFLLHRRDRSIWFGLATALVVSLIVAVPWYAAQYARFGEAYLQDVFGRNIVQRITSGVDPRHLAPPWFFVVWITKSSDVFALYIPAMLLSLVASFAGDRQRQFRFLSIFAIGWVGVFSLSSSKQGHYAYPAFPFIAIAIAELIRAAIVWGTIWIREPAPRAAAGHILIGIAAAALTLRAAWLVSHEIPRTQRGYKPLEIYAGFKPFLDAGTMRCIILADPQQLGMRDLFHFRRMEGAQWIADPQAARALLADRKPTLLLTPLPAPFDLPPSAEVLFSASDKHKVDRVLVALVHAPPATRDAESQ
jgi:4-amino-4-deoxy-L-arabinose transferase-like glycosyltransferase